jgi:hypothetical protein
VPDVAASGVNGAPAPSSPDMTAVFTELPSAGPRERTDVGVAMARLRGKHDRIATEFNYYDGDQPIVYATDQLNDYFRQLTAKFVENWCAPVIDAVRERIRLRGFDCTKGNEAASELLEELMESGGLGLEAQDVHTAAFTAGEGFLIATPDEDDASEVEVYANDPRSVHAFYDPRHPKRLRMAAKEFEDELSGFWYMTLYYADRLEHYRSRQPAKPKEAREYIPLPDDEGRAVEAHDWGRVPVFHFRRLRRRIMGELAGRVRPQQDMVNKLLADMMVASEFAGFRQRYALTNADLSDLEAGAMQLWKIPLGDPEDGQPQVGQFEVTELKNFLDGRTALAEGMAIISHTPKHYMTGATTPSGEALIAMDAPLTKKCGAYVEGFSAEWRAFAVFYCHLRHVELKGSDVTPLWDDPNIAQPETTSNVVRNYTAAQMPLQTALREEAKWTPKQLERMEEERAEQAAAAPPTLGEIALKAAASNLNNASNPEPVPGGIEEPAEAPAGNGKPKTPASPFSR